MNIRSTVRPSKSETKAKTDFRDPGLIVTSSLTAKSHDGGENAFSFEKVHSPREFSFFERNYTELRALRSISRYVAGSAPKIVSSVVDGFWFVVGAAATIEPLTRDTPDLKAMALAGGDFAGDYLLSPLISGIFGSAPGSGDALSLANTGKLVGFAAEQTLGAVIAHRGKLYYKDLRAPLAKLSPSPFPPGVSKELHPEVYAASKALDAVNKTFGLLARAVEAQEKKPHSLGWTPVFTEAVGDNDSLFKLGGTIGMTGAKSILPALKIKLNGYPLRRNIIASEEPPV